VRDGRGALYCFAESNKSGNAQPDLLSYRLVLKDETVRKEGTPKIRDFL
jgi:hypothetical protein